MLNEQALLKIDIRDTARSLIGTERMDLPNNIAVVLTGRMTVAQKDKVKKKVMIRRDKCLEAIRMLVSMTASISGMSLIPWAPETPSSPVCRIIPADGPPQD